MFKKAVVGFDLSPAEKPMMDCLPDLMRWGIEEVVLVHVIQVGYAEWEGFGHEDKYAKWLCEKAELLCKSGLRASIVVRDSGGVAQELISIANSESADLIVVGSRSHNISHSVFLGSVAKDVLCTSPLPVLLERIEPSASETEKVCASVCWEKSTTLLLATDFSECSRRAELAALTLLPFTDSAQFISVIDSLPDSPNLAREKDVAREKLLKLAKQVESYSDKVDVAVRTGNTAEVIAEAGEDIRSMLIVLGKHGRGWVSEAMLGSVAESVCRVAKRPVLMVP